MQIKLKLTVIYFCPHRLVSEYHTNDGRIFFCEFPSKWFKDFNTTEATEVYIQPILKEPDLIWDGEKLIVSKHGG